ncbi:hypothetical protein PF008_g32354 [Phytophthora fragariae]|uniref:RxLR effector protein n=1 Tax=Phytophthora fragariae TaxID=53985 RepID=A0A6G0Q009_9STRA|nr:hypothetical protein PF008_g32354 [Phytophthora fragariae]
MSKLILCQVCVVLVMARVPVSLPGFSASVLLATCNGTGSYCIRASPPVVSKT